MTTTLSAILLLLASLLTTTHHVTLATRYADTRRDEGGTPACWRRCVEVGPGGACARRFSDADFRAGYPTRVASRTLPCGTKIAVLAEGGRIALGTVLDRGPWGRGTTVRGSSRSRFVGPAGRHSGHGGKWRGDLDLSPRVAESIGLTVGVGRKRVVWWVVGN